MLKKTLSLINGKPVLLFLFVSGACLLSAHVRYDHMWDFLHYHYYNGFAFWTDRLGYDISPAGLNTYFNPLLDAMTFSLVEFFNETPFWYAFIRGIPFGLMMYVAFCLCRKLMPETKAAWLPAVAVAATGYAAFFQIGSSTNETETALMVLTALLLLADDFPTVSVKRAVVAGILLGAAAGLKMTAAIYCVSTGVTLILFFKRFERPFRLITVFAVSGLCGFLLTNGFWMLRLYTVYENPFFPFLNTIFKSSYFGTENYSFRTIFNERSVAEALLLPVRMALHKKFSYLGNNAFFDFRFVFAMPALAVFPFFAAKGRVKDITLFCVVWAVVGYVVWLAGFSVVRYLIPIEIMVGILLVKGYAFFWPREESLWEIVYKSLGVIGLFVLMSTPYQSSSWGGRAGQRRVFETPEAVLPDNAVVALINVPNAAYGARLAMAKPKTRLVGLMLTDMQETNPWFFTRDTKMYRQGMRLLRETPADNLFYWISLQGKPMLSRLQNQVCRGYGLIYSPRLDSKTDALDVFYVRRAGDFGYSTFCAPVKRKDVLSKAGGYIMDENLPELEEDLLDKYAPEKISR